MSLVENLNHPSKNSSRKLAWKSTCQELRACALKVRRCIITVSVRFDINAQCDPQNHRGGNAASLKKLVSLAPRLLPSSHLGDRFCRLRRGFPHNAKVKLIKSSGKIYAAEWPCHICPPHSRNKYLQSFDYRIRCSTSEPHLRRQPLGYLGVSLLTSQRLRGGLLSFFYEQIMC